MSQQSHVIEHITLIQVNKDPAPNINTTIFTIERLTASHPHPSHPHRISCFHHGNKWLEKHQFSGEALGPWEITMITTPRVWESRSFIKFRPIQRSIGNGCKLNVLSGPNGMIYFKRFCASSQKTWPNSDPLGLRSTRRTFGMQLLTRD